MNDEIIELLNKMQQDTSKILIEKNKAGVLRGGCNYMNLIAGADSPCVNCTYNYTLDNDSKDCLKVHGYMHMTYLGTLR